MMTTMKAAFAALTCLVVFACESAEREPRAEAAAIPESVAAELVRLGEEDQALRQGLTPEKMQDTLFAREFLRGDSLRTQRLREIVERYGWPDSTRVGAPAANSAFLMLQHSPDPQFQKEFIPTLEALAMEGKVARADVAMLIDRVLMHDSAPQRYGTQFRLEGGRFVLHPVEDEAGLAARRRAMGLPPMDEYVKLMEEFYKAPVAR